MLGVAGGGGVAAGAALAYRGLAPRVLAGASPSASCHCHVVVTSASRHYHASREAGLTLYLLPLGIGQVSEEAEKATVGDDDDDGDGLSDITAQMLQMSVRKASRGDAAADAADGGSILKF